jgi:peroxiredoxin Q/BCP
MEEKKAPDFCLSDQNEKEHCLKDYLGKKVLLYFYPKDDTPGCTVEACGIRDNFDSFKVKNLVVLGVSTDSVISHKKFEEKYKLPFTLLADVDKKVVELYGVWKEKVNFGKKYMGTSRESFLINEEGVVVKHFKKVTTATHAVDVLKT